MKGSRRKIEVRDLARVEGEGGLLIKLKGDQVLDVQLKIFEPPRFFEAFLRGRGFEEAPDLTARICGICPVAYQMSACHAMEDACDVRLDGPLRALRRLIYCGEWIESHTLHVYLLHAPDFLGFESGVAMAKRYPEAVARGLELKKAGNELISLLGGRSVHPVNVRLGGFYRVPTRAQLEPIADRLRWAREAALETVRWTAGFSFPDFEQDYTFLALRHPEEYPFNEGRLVTNQGQAFDVQRFEEHVVEEQVPYSTALHARLDGRAGYLVGPMARYNLNFDRLPPSVQEAARAAGLGPVCRNPFRSIVVRSLEILYACEEALRIIASYVPPDRASVNVVPRAAVGHGCTEAPRGILYHRYRIDEAGRILEAKIVPPTSQNQKAMEEDLRGIVPDHLHLPTKDLTWRCEQTVRNYDPCISCSTHFLRVRIDRS